MGKVILSDLTFIIPTRVDSLDREKNLFTIVKYLNKFFKTNIFILEVPQSNGEYRIKNYLNNFEDVTYIQHIAMDYFDKAYLLNFLVKKVTTKYACIYDTDVLLFPYQYILSLKLLKDNLADLVVGFDKRIFDTEKKYHGLLKNQLSMLNFDLKYTRLTSIIAMGGCVMFSCEKFKEIGMMNENMRSLGGQDDELIRRALTLGLRVRVLNDILIHLEHCRPPESSLGKKGTEKWRNSNLEELNKICSLNKEELKEYIKTWSWISD